MDQFHHLDMGFIHEAWRHLEPNVNVKRSYLVALVSCAKIYAIGGHGDNNDNNAVLDTMESIQVSSLLETETFMT